ncbi:helix-turn-helix domain-containing protein [Streptomyces tibetensis]|uniref:helix-turn-helix domain-containing protein n=1 Tax=Streptomyces tibetensis TaxID=2382123 RepID=UPI0037F465F6
MSEGTTAADFAALLGELKERSGLSYGVLAKRLHMSTSTLHRYCNGDAVPTDYAPVERLARLCKASPTELVELHRRWVLADAGRARRGSGGTGSAAAGSGGAGSGGKGIGGKGSAGTRRGAAEVTSAGADVPASGAAGSADADVPAPVEPPDADVPASEESPDADAPAPEQAAGRRRRRAVLAGVAAAVVLGGVGLAVAVPSGGDHDEGRRGAAVASGGAGAPQRQGTAASVSPSAGSPSKGSEDKNVGRGRDREKEEKASASAPPASASATGGAGRPGRDAAPAAAPLTVTTEPHAWESPCSQRYLVNLPPGQVKPPPSEPDAPGWVAAMGAVPSGEQFMKLTVQGTGKQTVVVKGLTVRMAGKRAPLAWNDYAMGYPGVGCGGGVPTRFFTVALDAARPGVVPDAGHADFPFTVSESDPEMYYIRADASAYDVSWYLELTWSSGGRTGTLTVDDHGRPFRTSGNNGRPAYEFPLGGEKWVEEGTTQ